MQNLPNIWIAAIPTYDAVLDVIEESLTILQNNAVDADFTDQKVVKKYSDDVLYMKQFFERAETLARGL